MNLLLLNSSTMALTLLLVGVVSLLLSSSETSTMAHGFTKTITKAELPVPSPPAPPPAIHTKTITQQQQVPTPLPVTTSDIPSTPAVPPSSSVNSHPHTRTKSVSLHVPPTPPPTTGVAPLPVPTKTLSIPAPTSETPVPTPIPNPVIHTKTITQQQQVPTPLPETTSDIPSTPAVPPSVNPHPHTRTKSVSLHVPPTPPPTTGAAPSPVPTKTLTVPTTIMLTSTTGVPPATTTTSAVPSPNPQQLITKTISLRQALVTTTALPVTTPAPDVEYPVIVESSLTRDSGNIMETEDLVLAVASVVTLRGEQTTRAFRYTWSTTPALPDTISPSQSQLHIPAGTFPVGTALQVVCSFAIADIPISAGKSETLSEKFTVVAAPVSVTILGGSRTVPAAGFTVSAVIDDPRGALEEEIVWSCTSNTEPTAACPAPLSSLPSGFDITMESVPVGTYTIGFTYKRSATNSASAMITVKETSLDVELVRVVEGSTGTSATAAHISSDPLEIFAVIPTPPNGGTEPRVTEWRVGTTAVRSPQKNAPVGYSLVLTPAEIEKHRTPGSSTLTISCSAASGSDVTGRAEIVVPLIVAPGGGACTLDHYQEKTEPFVSGSRAQLKARWDNGEEDQYLYRFGYLSLSGDGSAGGLTYFSTAASKQNELPISVPFAMSLSSPVVTFAAELVLARDGRRVGQTTCNYTVHSPPNLLDAVSKEVEAIDAAVSSGDSNAVLENAIVAAGALSSSSSSSSSSDDDDHSRKGQLRKKVVTAIGKMYGTGSRTMSRGERRATVGVITQLVRSARSTDGGESSSSLDTDEKRSVAAIVQSVLTLSKPSDLDTKTQAAPLLDVIADGMDDDKVLQKKSCQKLADAAAKNLGLSQSIRVKNSKFSLSAEKMAKVEALRRPMTFETTEVQLNDDSLKKIEATGTKSNGRMKSTSGISISSVEFTTPPVTTAEVETDLPTIPNPTTGRKVRAKTLCSRTVEYDLQWDATTIKVADLSKDDALKMKLKTDRYNKNNDNDKFQVVYYNTSKGKWTTEGVLNGDYDAATNTFSCSTTHFSLFAVTYEEDIDSDGDNVTSTAGSSTSSSADITALLSPNDQDVFAATISGQPKFTMDKAILLVVIILSAAFLLVIIVAILVLKCSKNMGNEEGNSSNKIKTVEAGMAHKKQVAGEGPGAPAAELSSPKSLDDIRPPSHSSSSSKRSWTDSLEFEQKAIGAPTIPRSYIANDIRTVEDCV